MKLEDAEKRITCPSCKAANTRPEIVETPHLPHFGKAVCFHCGNFIDWIAKPDSDASKYRRPNQHRNLVKKYGRGFCELCLTPEGDLPDRQVLEAHHVMEYQDTEDSSRENIWVVCTGCSRLIHWRRYYSGQPKVRLDAESVGSVQ